MKHFIMSSQADSNSYLRSFSTPTPSVQSEPVSSEPRVTLPKASGRPILDSPMQNRFRKKKNQR